MKSKFKAIFLSFFMIAPFLNISCSLIRLPTEAAPMSEVEKMRFEGEIEKSYEVIWDAIKKTAKEQGHILGENFDTGKMDVAIGDYLVEIWLRQIVQHYGIVSIKAYDPKKQKYNIEKARTLYDLIRLRAV